MRHILLILIFTILASNVFSQNGKAFTLNGTIVDKENNSALPYATVFNKNKSKGTAADLNGSFELPQIEVGDSIVISYIGYEDIIIVAKQSQRYDIKLERSTNQLDEIVIRADDEYLYKIVRKIRKNSKTKSKKAKTYFYLESTHKGETTELIETYFNGSYKNGSCTSLNLKKGRIGIKPIDNRYFLSTETSKVFVQYDHYKKNKKFPQNPLYLSKRELRKKYKLELREAFNDRGNQYYKISFEPRKGINAMFHGTLIVDIKNNILIKINLNIQDAEVHPFVPFGYTKIKKIDLSITKSYSRKSKDIYIESMYFNYNITYTDKDNHIVHTKTNAFIKPYEYHQSFYPILFEFSEAYHRDYRNITLGPYDSIYWQTKNEFCFYEKESSIEEFVNNNFIENNFIIATHERPQLEFKYNIWDEDRVILKESDVQTIEKAKSTIAFPEERYNLNIKLYLDFNFIEGKLHYQLYSVLDPISTFYHFYITDIDHAFINIYFDLMEIEKRKLEILLKDIKSSEAHKIENLYKDAIASYKEESKKYTKEVRRGKDHILLQKWNDIINQELGINNINAFGMGSKK